jgi:ParB family chromosome partitioning protein
MEMKMTTAIKQIPLSKLVTSEENVRKTNGKDGLKELAASIKAHGLLQNLTVKPSGKKFEVIAGGRRLSALNILASAKELPKDTPVPCNVIGDDEKARELSLAENVGQAPMHPADQYEAFSALHVQEGMSAEDIASRFGVSVSLVKQRLSLGAVSPKLMRLYRNGDLNLDQLSAFTICPDHKRQERVWKDLPRYSLDRRSILEALSEGHVPSDDRRARFVGAKAYQKAGGTIVRDLFDDEHSGYFADADLLNRLVRERLQAHAAPVLAEGWKWVSVEPVFDRQLTASMRRVHPCTARLSKADQARVDALEAEHESLVYGESVDEEDVSDEAERIEREIKALTGDPAFDPAEIARAGAYVSLGADGEPEIKRGFVRTEDDKPAADEEGGDGEICVEEKAKGEKPISAALVAELTATRTVLLRASLSKLPNIALIAVTHALAANVFYSHKGEHSCLEMWERSTCVAQLAPKAEELPEAIDLRAQHEAWQARLPDDPASLWEFLVNADEQCRSGLLAYCAALSVNALRLPKAFETGAWKHADALASAVGLDMSAHWQPTAANYFGRVSKERVLEAVREGASGQEANRLGSMKKQDMAAAAERLLAGKGWLPPPLR